MRALLVRTIWSLILVCTCPAYAVATDRPAGDRTVDGDDPGITCEAHLREREYLPPGYGFDPAEFERMSMTYADLGDEGLLYANLAHFVEDPAGDNFFELLGSYAGAGFAAGFFKLHLDFEPTPTEQRGLQLRMITRVAETHGFYPRHFGAAELNFFAESLGPLETQRASVLTKTSLDRWATKLAEYRKKKAGFAWPTPASLALHSQIAQYAYVKQVMALADHTEDDVLRLTKKLQRRWQRKNKPETAAERTALNLIEAAIDLDPDVVLKINGHEPTEMNPRLHKAQFARLVPAQSEWAIAQVLDAYVLHRMTVRKRGEPDAVYASPINMLNAFETISHSDSFSDQGHVPLLRRLVSELVLGRPALTGAQARTRVKTLLLARLKRLRTTWRARVKDATSAPPVPEAARPVDTRTVAQAPAPSRAERRRAHAARTRGTTAVPDAGANPGAWSEPAAAPSARPAPPASARSIDPEPPTPWANLFDRALSPEDVRQKFAAQIKPEVAMRIFLHRTGYTYNVILSERLIEQMLNPRRGEPTDLRRWLQAIQLGPARPRRQRGWKKFAVPIDRIYGWEIKILRSPYRILGYATGEGAWYFDKIELIH